MLNARNLECIRGDRSLFTDLNFLVEPGCLLHVQGPNGSGKTSLLRMLCRLVAPAQGEILWKGENIRRLREEYHRDLTYLGHHSGVKDELTALENLLISCAIAASPIEEDQALAALRRIGLAGREDLPAKYLSQGQKRRVALARLLVGRTALWILDEPFTALDTHAISLLQDVIGAHLAGGGTVVLTTHQPVQITAGTSKTLQLRH